MIKYALICICEHKFDAWFQSSDAYDDQIARGFVECPVCGSVKIAKQIMSPAVRSSDRSFANSSGKTNLSQFSEIPSPEDIEKIASKVRQHIASTHTYVGDKFADSARAMHYGDAEKKAVWGETTPQEAKSLLEEGVAAIPLPEPFAPPIPISKDNKKLN